VSELNDFIQEFKNKINEPPKPKMPKVKIIDRNNIPTYEGHVELLDKGMEFEPVYELFKPQPRMVTQINTFKYKYEQSSFEFLYVNSTKVFNICCALTKIIEDRSLVINVSAFDGWNRRINCDIVLEYSTDLTVYEFAVNIVTYLWRCKLVE
jgi:hypothetical protein